MFLCLFSSFSSCWFSLSLFTSSVIMKKGEKKRPRRVKGELWRKRGRERERERSRREKLFCSLKTFVLCVFFLLFWFLWFSDIVAFLLFFLGSFSSSPPPPSTFFIFAFFSCFQTRGGKLFTPVLEFAIRQSTRNNKKKRKEKRERRTFFVYVSFSLPFFLFVFWIWLCVTDKIQ